MDDSGLSALLFGLVAAGIIWITPRDWLKAAGGLLVLATGVLTVLGVLQWLSR
jgi:cytochrome c biogenesis protein CcdA